MMVSGGNFIAIADSLRPSTRTNIHNAVQSGMNYLGICAGAFLAGHGTYKSLNPASGVRFGFYRAEKRGVRKANVAITGIGTFPIEQYWEDGPELTGWAQLSASIRTERPRLLHDGLATGG